MFSLIVRQTSWGVIGVGVSFIIGILLKIYLLKEAPDGTSNITLDEYGEYVVGQTLASVLDTFLALGLPFLIIKYIPNLIKVNLGKAKKIASFCLSFSILIGLVFVILICCFDSYISTKIYGGKITETILCLMSIYIPTSLFMAMIISLYRSFLKIKEIVIYGTIFNVLSRAILTFIVFESVLQPRIEYFIYVEIIVQIITLSILTFKFNKDSLNINFSLNFTPIAEDARMFVYTISMYGTSIVAYFGGKMLVFLITIPYFLVSREDIAAYSILLSITSITTMLLIKLNEIFAPVISKLFVEGRIEELSDLYKRTTFIINFFTIPFVIIIILLSNDILSLFGGMGDNEEYTKYLILLMCGGLASLSAGSSGQFLIYANLEIKNLVIQIFKALFLFFCALFFIRDFGLFSVVLIYLSSMIFVNLVQVIILWFKHKITPYSFKLILLYLMGFVLYLYLKLFLSYLGLIFPKTSEVFLLKFILTCIVVCIIYILIYKKEISLIIKDFGKK